MPKNRRLKQLVISSEAKKDQGQHTFPCDDCPWTRKSMPGWLGGLTVDEWLAAAHGEAWIECHTSLGTQCVGAARYRANMAKLPRDINILRTGPDRKTVFATPTEFRKHHTTKS